MMVGTRGIVARVEVLVQGWDRVNGDEGFPAGRLAALGSVDAASAFRSLKGPGDVDALARILRLIGGADLSLGRVFEGHVNAIQLIEAYGDERQRAILEADLAAARTFGVWNTEPAPGMTMSRVGSGVRLSGSKCFATGAGYIERALITARDEDGARRLILADTGDAGRADNNGWSVRGMRGTMSGTYNFEGLIVDDDALIGEAGDYEREPRFSAGAWRFTAVQLGAAEALLRHWRDHLVATGKSEDPIQRARFARSVVAVRSAASWVERAATLAEAEAAEAIAHVLMTRGVVEDAALGAMEGAARAVGTASFFEGSRIDRITRDLGLYLRQPVPDQARDRAAAAWIEADRWGDDAWW